ncbi:MAG: rhomboid family intramembrane serine protease [Candidatus Rokubacteria bacterium]|jgi:membrane associated rhomboid family serine protease|nr:rhomboid family intramembrane serine protease [Candidatus Rokubacteria bacterium]
MFPLKDDVPSQTTPFVTIGLITLNVLVFLYQWSLQFPQDPEAVRSAQAFVFEFGVTPCRLTGRCAGAVDFPSPVATIFTSMFVHGGLFHVFGNMLYLWIFGDNVEDTLGHVRFLLFYLAAGVAAAVGQSLVNPASQVPMIGASGAISGVLGAYLILFPHAGVLTVIVFMFFVRLVRVPAVLVLGFWIVVQIINGLVTFGAGILGRAAEGGVAWFAHVGGFLAGIVLLFLMRPRAALRL